MVPLWPSLVLRRLPPRAVVLCCRLLQDRQGGAGARAQAGARELWPADHAERVRGHAAPPGSGQPVGAAAADDGGGRAAAHRPLQLPAAQSALLDPARHHTRESKRIY